MCVGIPMQVLAVQPGRAHCEGMGELRWVDTLLIDEPQVGDWLLTFLGSAREILDPQHAKQIQDALQALRSIEAGELDVDAWFPDLVDREPQLPDFLK
jgi:hydrogenase expression/formation protein HypC